MGIKFNADEVFEMAIRAEENGGKFYRRAAEVKADDQEAVELLLKLAKMEDGHKETFEKMRQELGENVTEQTTFDPYMEASLYLAAMADGSHIEGAPSVAGKLTAEHSLKDILITAVGLEKEAVLFYTSMKDMVSLEMGKRKVDEIIEEEKVHIVQLTAHLKKLDG